MSEFEEKLDVDENLLEEEEDVSIASGIDDNISETDQQGDDETIGSNDDGDFDVLEGEEQNEYQNEDDENDEEGFDLNENIINNPNDDNNYDDQDEDDDYEHDLRKFENIEKNDYIENYHQSLVEHNDEEINALTTVIRDNNNNIIDDLHKTMPILTKYEKARILGLRASQINNGAQIFVKPKMKTFNGYLIAIQELEEKKIPFIIKRPLPMGGGCEYWKLDDLEII